MDLQTLGKSLVACVAGTLLAGNASAQVIGIDFNNGGPANQSPGTSDVVGPVPVAGWVNLLNIQAPPTYYTHNIYNPSDHGNPVTLNDTTGAPTTVKFGFNSDGLPTLNGGTTYSPSYGGIGTATAGLTGDQQLYNGGVFTSRNGYVQEISLIDVPYAQYDVYLLVGAQIGDPGYGTSAPGLGNVTVYTDYDPSTFLGNQGATYWFSSITNNFTPSAGFSYVQATGTTQASATLGANYVLYSGLTSANVVFDLNSPDAGNNVGAYITGVQIVAVPEPSAVTLLGGAGCLVFAFRLGRRKLRCS